MFLRSKRRFKNGKWHRYYSVVEDRRATGRPDCRQVVIALIVTPDGLPLAYEVMPGNTSDKTTLNGSVSDRHHTSPRQ